MRTLAGIGLSLVLAGSLFAQGHAQGHGSAAPFITGGPGNAVFPAGTPANNPFITRVPSNVVYPGGGGPHFVIPGTTPRVPRSSFTGAAYAYPVYVPSYDPSMYAGYGAPAEGVAQQQGQQAPNVVVIYPPSGAPAMMGPPPDVAHPSMQVYEPDTGRPINPSDEQAETSRYLLAFKDHSIYSVVAYWVDGDTIHYFTSGNTHKQASLSSLDRDLTDRLNKESGSDFKLPAAK